MKKLSALRTELTGNIADLRHGATFVSCGCLELLLQTRYVDIGPDLLKQAYELWRLLKGIEGRASRTAETKTDAIPLLQALAVAIFSIERGIGRGEFTGPQTISSMVWIVDEPFRRSCAYTRATPLTAQDPYCLSGFLHQDSEADGGQTDPSADSPSSDPTWVKPGGETGGWLGQMQHLCAPLCTAPLTFPHYPGSLREDFPLPDNLMMPLPIAIPPAPAINWWRTS
jgi:hypothetical protein